MPPVLLCHRPLLAALVLTVAAGSCADATDRPEQADPVPVTGSCDDDGLASALAAWGGAGFNGSVVVDGPDRSCHLGVGRIEGDAGPPITTDTTFAIGSVSKAVVAVAVLRLEAAGKLALTDPAGQHVTGLSGPAADATIESLLLHTSGLVGSHGQDHVALGRDDAVAAISALEVDEASKGRFLYSNAGYTLLALVMEGASSVEYRRLLVDEVLPDGAGFWDGEPAAAGERAVGLRDGEPTGFDGSFAGPHWALQGNGDVAMSAALLAEWTRDAFTGTSLPPAAIDRMSEGVVDDDGQGVTVGWGRLEADVFGEVAIGAAGGGGDVGHEVVALWLPESERVVVVASSTDQVTAEALLRSIGPAIVDGEPIPRPDDPVEVDDEVLDAAEGSYAIAPADGFEVVRADGGLDVTPTGGTALEALLPPDATQAEVADHEAAVVSLLAGETDAGAEEVAVLEDENGPLRDVTVLGSTSEGELRTYVDLTFADARATGWYALNDSGGIEGVDLGGLPQVHVTATADGFRIDGRPPGGDAVTVTFADDAITVRGPTGTVVAERA